MEATDLVQFEKKLKREFFKKTYRQLSLKLKLEGIFSLFDFNLMKSLINTNIYSENLKSELANVIINSDMYKSLEEYYYTYLLKLATFFKEEGITDALGISLFFQELLDSGNLSYNRKHSYNYYMTKKDYIKYKLKYENELLGSYVITGSSVCRHMTYLLVDLENYLEKEVYNANVFTENKSLVKNLKNINTNHSVAIIVDKDLLFAYCPTNKRILDVSFASKTNGYDGYQYFYLTNISKTYKEYYNNYIAPLDNNYDIERIYNNNSYRSLTEEELSKRKVEISLQFLDEELNGSINNFYNKTKKDLDLISKKIFELTPSENGKVKSLIIT